MQCFQPPSLKEYAIEELKDNLVKKCPNLDKKLLKKIKRLFNYLSMKKSPHLIKKTEKNTK